ncbi:FAD-dependent oxidoreductase [Oxynema aestuarii]|jgi:lycopene cyclase CruP|uniref:FAD-binding oxidoreductase n=1 Tax=Oxynema aestuarii AP17 TaxID=2064643 RepID=A0A6H1TZQ5_9CYAN|nr:FAD-binding oxidoreductase [Oxynema aestuarii]QIZ72092.1 FAD-binding oxidoreductase [Oxynema aestuarii AP17]
MQLTEKILSQIPGNPWKGLQAVDRRWQALKEGNIPQSSPIAQNEDPLGELEWDVVISGGTLGIFIGAALAKKGWRVAVLERGILKGRNQEWNVSRSELDVFIKLGLLDRDELERAIATEYNPARIQFDRGPEFLIRDVLNLGVDPVYLLDLLKTRFLEAGGKLFENTAFEGATVHPDGIAIQTRTTVQNDPEANTLFKSRLLLDVMGHFSPIVNQARRGQKPDGVCLVVGTCAQGFPANETGDLMVSFTPIQKQCQYFWEAFPARDGRTTYLFTYVDASPERLSLVELFEDYWRLLPQYQNVECDRLEVVRALFGFFPAYRQSPLKSPWNRLVFVGDSSGIQSPLSFGGFGAMLRHLERLQRGIDEALDRDLLDAKALGKLQPYQPNIAVTWLFQKAMSIPSDRPVQPNQINDLLSGVFADMKQLGDPVLKPFLQDVIQFGGLSQTLLKTGLTRPGAIVPVVGQVGWSALIDWMQQYLNLGLYSALSAIARPLTDSIEKLPPKGQYYCRRWFEGWYYGSGKDRDASDR